MRSAADTVYAELRRRLILGHYAPGTQMKESALAAEMSVSRTPVRVALGRLVDERQLEAHANRGVFVAAWTARDTAEVFDLRVLLEGHAAWLAAARATPQQVDGLRALNEGMAALAERLAPERVFELQTLNSRFHQGIVAASHSPRLIDIARGLIDWPLIAGTFYLFSASDLARSIGHHADILAAITAGDGTLARTAMNLHLRRSRLDVEAKRNLNTIQRDERFRAPGEPTS